MNSKKVLMTKTIFPQSPLYFPLRVCNVCVIVNNEISNLCRITRLTNDVCIIC